MFVVVTITANQKKPSDVGSRLVRAENAGKVIVYDTTGCQFNYSLNYRDRREKPTQIKCSDSVTDITDAMNLEYNQVDLTLPVYPDDDTSKSTVDTVYTVDDVQWGMAYPSDATKSWVWVLDGAFKLEKILVDYTLAELVLLANTGSAS